MYNKIYSLEELYSFYIEYVCRTVVLNWRSEYNKHKILDYPEWLDFDYLEKYYQYGEKRFYSEKDKELHLLRRNNCQSFEDWYSKLNN